MPGLLRLSGELQQMPLTRGLVMKFKMRSLRHGAWFRVLECEERGLVDATLCWLSRIRSDQLRRVMIRILSKLATAMSSALWSLRDRGRPIASRMSELAVRWKDQLAWSWRFDDSFQICLGAGIVGSTR